MQKELKNITEDVMKEIHQGKVKMKPKIYFIIGSIFTFIGVTFSVMISIFLIGLIKFSMRNHGPMGQYKLGQMISEFPWWTILFAVLGLVVGIWLIRQYDFSYKKEPWIIISGFILAVIVAGWTIDTIGLNDTLLKRGPIKGIMNNYTKRNIQKNSIQKEIIENRLKNNPRQQTN